MFFFFPILIVYISFLVFYRPQPSDLRQQRPSLLQNIFLIPASLGLGILFMVIFLITSQGTFISIPEDILTKFSVEKMHYFSFHSLFKLLASNFLHLNLIHLLSNLTALGLCSFYERRVGSKKFLLVFCIGIIGSDFSLLFYPSPMILIGSSGGVFALTGAYFTDFPDLHLKDWLSGLAVFLILFIVLSIPENQFKNSFKNYHIDYLGHLFGGLAGIFYCRFFRHGQIYLS